MKLYQQILVENDCYKRGQKIRPLGVMVHSTGCCNSWLVRYVQPDDNGRIGVNRYGTDWNRPGIGACVHAFIGRLDDGSIATYQTLPWDHRGWHCGGPGNDSYISFEICEDTNDPQYFRAVYREAVELTAYLCSLYNFDPMEPGVVICHAEGYRMGLASNHADVEHWFSKCYKVTMDDFRKDVEKEMLGDIEKAKKAAVKAVYDMGQDQIKHIRWQREAAEKAMKALKEEKVNIIDAACKEAEKRQRQRDIATRKKAPSDWAADDWRWARDHGVVKGNGDGTDSPRSFITRQEVVAMLRRITGK